MTDKENVLDVLLSASEGTPTQQTNTNRNEAPPLTIPENGLSFDDAVAQYKRFLVFQALERTGGNVTRAAKLIGMDRRCFYRVKSGYTFKKRGKKKLPVA